MKCFNHTDRDAVAYCYHCGKALCRECASVYSPCMCQECAQAVQQHERHRLWQEDYSQREARAVECRAVLRERRICALIGLIPGLAMGQWYFQLTVEPSGYITAVCLMLFGFVMAFGAPFGWNLMSHMQRNMPTIWIFGSAKFIFMAIMLKIMLCILFGIPGMIYLQVKSSKAKRELRALEVCA